MEAPEIMVYGHLQIAQQFRINIFVYNICMHTPPKRGIPRRPSIHGIYPRTPQGPEYCTPSRQNASTCIPWMSTLF
ncbi:hypothetical protein J437_LFUL001648 [Ladona fulva]|uniref:Uncharacterized protein n=1 Tax=Ladona fulva TaxID=123851 RepID=A0A8K0NWH1_LADFU|nr:hypothetical protein J437_LFUL001648 [Ladona fulva]